MNPSLNPVRRVAPRVGIAAGCLVLTCAMAACGSSGDLQTVSTPSTATSAGANGQPGGPGAGGFPGASGEVVAVSGTTAQVRNERTGQVAVSWTEATTFTTTRSGTLSDIVVGSCVVVFATSEDEGAASRVSVSGATNGDCEQPGGPGGPARANGGEWPTDLPSDLPSDFPSGFPAGAPGGQRPDMGSMIAGKVTAISGRTIAVDGTELTLAGDTTVTTTVAAAARDVVEGSCVTARGEADSVGAVTATTIAVSQPVEGECGFGGMGGFPGGRP